MLLYLVSVALVAAATIVLFFLSSISLLDTSKETLTGSRLDNSPIEGKLIGTVVSYTDSNAAPVTVQTKSPSPSEANKLPSSTPVPLPSGMPREETVAEPALNLAPDGEASTAAVETPHDSTWGPSTGETPPPELSGSQEVIAQPRSTADEASTAQHASGATMPSLGTPDEERDQMFQDFEIQRNHHANLDEGSVAFIPPEETQVKESTGFYAASSHVRAGLCRRRGAQGLPLPERRFGQPERDEPVLLRVPPDLSRERS
jgi:hypothetical protein